MVKANGMINGCESGMGPNGAMQGFIGNHQFDFANQSNPDAKAKKMKMDSESQFIGNANNGQTGMVMTLF